MNSPIPPNRTPASVGSSPTGAKSSALEAQIHKLFKTYEEAGLPSNDVFHNVLISVCALTLIADQSRSDHASAMKRDLARLETIAAGIQQVGDRAGKAIVNVEHATQRIEHSNAMVAGNVAKLEDLDRRSETHTARIEQATSLDLPSIVAGYTSMIIAVVVGGLLIGATLGYNLGVWEVFGSRYTVAERVERTLGIDELSAKALSDIVPLNRDLGITIARCRDTQLYYSKTERFYCDWRIIVPPLSQKPVAPW
ncbi:MULTISPECIES: hypothetical protein [Methylobacterium]|uniref:Uncharacterized protein n=1 Tax=Methylobacterium bullatum TaxID=570505 RepID=A0A679K0N7_9HYPH|nr:hypothetical protein [Methylobacterium sp. Leaf106]CAA2145567.1 hypothetical protein MBLL_04693 [Methylobacterium bullatum]